MGLRRFLRKWLIESEPEPDPYLDCLVSTRQGQQLVKYLIVGSRGLCLLGQPVDGSPGGIRAIRQEEAVSNRKFWALYYKLNPGVNFTWEDGTPYDPSA